MTGSDYERDFARLLSDLGLSVMRSPSSGGGTARDQPDILAAGPTVAPFCVELKSGKGPQLYVEESEVLALEAFAAPFDADTYLGARFTTRDSPRTFYLLDPADARVTPGGNYVLDLEWIDKRAARTFGPGGSDG